MRRIVLDIETTGFYHDKHDRIVEIACVELDGLKTTGNEYQTYLSPGVRVDPGAFKVHGLSDEFLENQPEFGEIVDDFLAFIGDDELVAHNGNAFDMKFIQKELALIERPAIRNKVFDTLVYARQTRPGKMNGLDALVKAFKLKTDRVDGVHGALQDSRTLAKVYCYMLQTRGSGSLELEQPKQVSEVVSFGPLIVRPPTPSEAEAHRIMLTTLKLQAY